jgi:myosin heavy subunit
VYLLEKNRVVRQGDGERSFHILHYLAAGASGEERRSLKVGAPESYGYLQREARRIAGVNDAAMFKAVCACMGSIGIDAAAQKTVWKVSDEARWL